MVQASQVVRVRFLELVLELGEQLLKRDVVEGTLLKSGGGGIFVSKL